MLESNNDTPDTTRGQSINITSSIPGPALTGHVLFWRMVRQWAICVKLRTTRYGKSWGSSETRLLFQPQGLATRVLRRDSGRQEIRRLCGNIRTSSFYGLKNAIVKPARRSSLMAPTWRFHYRPICWSHVPQSSIHHLC